MQQQISVITLGVRDLQRSGRFYGDGFGWSPVFQNEEIAFYQMNGFVFGTWLKPALEADSGRNPLPDTGAFALAHNVVERDHVAEVMARLVEAGGTLIREADAPPHGGMRGYVADPDGHAWEIAWNPAWGMDEKGLVTFAV